MSLAAISLVTAGGNAWADCSSYRSKVVINEVRVSTQSGTPSFVEIKTLDPGVVTESGDFDGWKLAVYRGSFGNKGEANVSSVFQNIGKNVCGETSVWIRIPDADLGNKLAGASSLNLVLWDSNAGTNGQIIDIMRLGDPATSYYGAGSEYDACPTIEAALPASGTSNTVYDAMTGSGSSVKDYYRNPDGTGTWNGNGTSAGSNTNCGSNNGGSAFSLSKVASASTVAAGANFTYTFYLNNGATGSAYANVVVTDPLTATGLNYVSCTPSGSCSFASGVFTWTVGAVAADTQQSATVTVNASSAGTVTNTATASNSGTTIGTASASVTVTTSTTPAANFNCLDSTLGALADYSAGLARLYTKLVGTSFSLDVVALNSGGGLETNFVGSGGAQKTVSLELVDNSQGTACPAGACSAACGQNVATKTIRFPANDTTGRSNIDNASGATVAFSVPAAYRNLICRVTDSSLTRCSSDAFAVRPTQFSLSHTLGTEPYVAGNAFTLSAATAVSGYDTTPKINTSLVKAANTAGVVSGSQAALGAGMLTLADAANTALASATSFADSTTSPSLRYHDVGYLYFNAGSVYDDTFVAAAIDPAGTDCIAGGAASGNLQACEIWSSALNDVGRFKLDHFELAFTTAPGCSAGAFTYMDDDALDLAMTIKAASSQGKQATRYVDGYPNAATLALAVMGTPPAGSLTDLSPRLSQPALPIAPVWAAGEATVSDTFRFDARTFATPAQDGPYNDLRLRLTVTDATDSTPVTLLTREGVAATPVDVSVNDGTATSVRYGRLKFDNAVGSELLQLPALLRAQYWDSSAGWRVNTADNCTAISAPPTVLAGATAVSAEYASSAAGPAGAVGNLVVSRFSVPAGSLLDALSTTPSLAAATMSSGQLTVLMSAPGTGKYGADKLTTYAPAWLKYGSGAGDPVATLRFGGFRGNEKFIYMRENF